MSHFLWVCVYWKHFAYKLNKFEYFVKFFIIIKIIAQLLDNQLTPSRLKDMN